MKVKLLSGEEISDLLHDDNNFQLDGRIKYFMYGMFSQDFHLAIFDDKKIIAMAGLQVNPYDEKQLWVKFVSVDPQYQGNGHARTLIESIYKYASENKLCVVPSEFTKEGQRIKHIFGEFDKAILEKQNDSTRDS